MVETHHSELAGTDPQWPAASGPYLFAIESTGPLEQKIIEEWIANNRPASVDAADAQLAVLPQNRRRRRKAIDKRLEAFLGALEDPLVVPVRMVWLAPEQDGQRMVGLQDLLIPGDPRDPNIIRQKIIMEMHPDRARVLIGPAARASELRERWQTSEGEATAPGRSYAEFVALQAWLALELSERQLRGSRYKVPKFPRESLIERKPFARAVAQYSRESESSYQQMNIKMRYYVREIAATHSPYVIDIVTGAISWLFDKAYGGLEYDKEELATIYQMSQRYPLVFLPSHKSNFDHMVLHYVLYQNGLPPNHTAGGINMNFFPVGPFLRRSGVFFIRREFRDNEPYKFVLRQYLDYLLERRFPLEWFIEGGRSRSGKMRAPRLGMLAYIVESFQRGAAEDVIMIPVSIAYDQIQDVKGYTAEATGGGKESESLSWMLKSIRGISLRYGKAHLRFGAPISLANYLKDAGVEELDTEDDRNPAIPKLAFEISNRINEATPITPVSLVTLALLTDSDRSVTVDETMERLIPYLDLIKRRDLPVTTALDIGNRDEVEYALEQLEQHGVVAKHGGGTDVVYRIGEKQHLSAAYYRNTIIHFFVNASITELALAAASELPESDGLKTVIEESRKIRDLLKFEFFFSASDVFADEIRLELSDHDPEWRTHLEDHDYRKTLQSFAPYQSPAILRPFVEAYRIVADLIDKAAYEGTIDTDQLLKDAVGLGKQYLLQGVIASDESVTKVLFERAIQLAENRKLFTAGSDMVERRQAFASEIRAICHRIDDLAAGTGQA